MPSTLRAGIHAAMERRVQADHCIRRGAYDIFSTPQLVTLIEEAAIEALAPHLGSAQSSVGSRVEVDHLAPTLLGQRVRATATAVLVDRRRVVFDVEVHDEVEVVASGRHERFVVDVPQFEQRLGAKSEHTA